jgi:hypothetical protein
MNSAKIIRLSNEKTGMCVRSMTVMMAGSQEVFLLSVFTRSLYPPTI